LCLRGKLNSRSIFSRCLESSEVIYQRALARARREHPEARKAVARMYEQQRWHFWWARDLGFDVHVVARAMASVDGAVKAA
jgi:hypothetical protein